MVDLTPDQLAVKLVQASQAAHQGAFKGMQKGCLIGQRTAMKYCTPGESPFDPMVFPTKKGGTGAPLDTGLLRAHLYIKVDEEGDQINGGVGCGDSGQEGPTTIAGYPLFVHEGTGGRNVAIYAGGRMYQGSSGEGMQPRPFIRRAIEDEAANIEKAIGDEIWNAITQAALL
jgi:hypothetical protein